MAAVRARTSDRLVEREAELGDLRDLAAAAAQGHGGAVVLEGPAGIGKTTLLGAAEESAQGLGLERLAARGGELERDFAYGVVRQLLEPRMAATNADDRAELLQGAAGLAAPLLGLAVDAKGERHTGALGDDPTAAALHGLYWLTANLAAESPLLVAVDDLHWSDTASLRFFAYLARRIGELPILLLAASRPPIEAHAPELLEAVGADPAVRRLEPAPLSAPAVAALVRAELGAEAGDEFCRACHDATGGNPLLLHSLLGVMVEEGLAPSAAQAVRLPEVASKAVARPVARRLAGLGGDAAVLARAVAVLGTNAEARRAIALGGLAEAAGARAADALAAADVLGPGRPLEFVHPIVRTAVHEGIPPAERARLHLAAARLLDAEGGDAERVAPHLLVAEPAADPWVVEVLRAAAARSVERGAPDAAVRYLSRALEEPPEAGLRGEVLAELGKAEVRAALPDKAVGHLREALAETPDPRGRAFVAHDLTLGLVAPGRYVEAVTMLEEAAEAASGVDQELALRVEAELLCGARLVAETLPLARERFQRLPKEIAGGSPGERMLLATLAHQRVLDGGTAAEAVTLAAKAVEGGLVGEQSGDSGLVIDAVFALIVGGDFERASAVIEEALADVRRRGSVIGFARETCMRAILNLRLGALAEAESDARNTIEAAWQPGYRVARMAYSPLLLALVEQGKLDEAQRALCAAGLEREIPDSFMLNFVLFARARLRSAQGRREQAIADLEELGRREQKWRDRNPEAFPRRSELALALAREGEKRGALAAAREELGLARSWGTAGAIGRSLRVLGLLETGERGQELLRESLELLRASPWRLEHARTLVELGAAIRRSGRRREARERLHAGMELAHACGAKPLVEQAHRELVATGARPRRVMRSGVASLTASERRVAGMAADGMTNREIAQALFVTTRTVEIHLTHAYQKLEISSREQLQGALAG